MRSEITLILWQHLLHNILISIKSDKDAHNDSHYTDEKGEFRFLSIPHFNESDAAVMTTKDEAGPINSRPYTETRQNRQSSHLYARGKKMSGMQVIYIPVLRRQRTWKAI